MSSRTPEVGGLVEEDVGTEEGSPRIHLPNTPSRGVVIQCELPGGGTWAAGLRSPGGKSRHRLGFGLGC